MSKEYNFSKPSSQCLKCQKSLGAGEEVVAVLRECGEEFKREDHCAACYNPAEPLPSADEIVGVWHTQVPEPQQKKKLFVDNELLANFFHRLEDADEPARINFRFVLALVLMRKKLLVYDGVEKQPDGQEIWKMHFKGNDTVHKVIDPKMDETKIAEVSQNLGEILEGEL